MKKFLIAGLFILCFAGCVCATEVVNKGYISLNTETTEELDPNVVKISFAIETKADNANEAGELNRKTSEKAINAVKALINKDKGETISTTSFNVYPEYSYKDGKQKLLGYKASNSLKVTLKDTQKAGKVISTALSNGANSINNIQFILDDTSEHCNKLIQTASKNARARADKVAESMGTSITGIKYISVGCSSNQSFNSNRMYVGKAMAMNSDSAQEAAEMPIEAGKGQLRAYVNAEFYVK